MNFTKIFEEIVSITHHHYAGCLDKKGWDSPEEFRNKLKELEDQNLLHPQKFAELISDYLLDFKDLHMSFKLSGKSNQKMTDVGFRVRRYENLLYIFEVGKEDRVQKGMAIKSLDNLSISQLSEIHKRELAESKHERERWGPILKKYKTCEVIDQNGQSFLLDLKHYDLVPQAPEYSLKRLNENTLFMKLTDFWNGDAVNQLLKLHEAELNECPNLIIDVRTNGGGNDTSYFELLHYIVDHDCKLEEFLGTDDQLLFHCTDVNFENKIKPMVADLEQIKDEATRSFYELFINEWEKNRGKGFVEFDFSAFAEDFSLQSKAKPEKIFILSDYYCGSSGDAFVEVCKNSKKVTVIGRATQGVTDYGNVAVKRWDHQFELWYPTSRVSKIDRGEGLTGKGVQPHVYIPWTPEHIVEDVDLKMALSVCEQSERV